MAQTIEGSDERSRAQEQCRVGTDKPNQVPASGTTKKNNQQDGPSKTRNSNQKKGNPNPSKINHRGIVSALEGSGSYSKM